MAQAKIGRGVKITFLGHSAFKLTGRGGERAHRPLAQQPVAQHPGGPGGAGGPHPGDPRPRRPRGGNRGRGPGKPARPVVAIHELSVILAGQGAPQVIGMNKGGTLAMAGCKVTMTHAVHSSAVEEGGKLVAAGDPGGFVVEFPNGFVAYHAGDTAVFKDMELIRELYHPELAMLPIGSHYVMSPAEAALACRMLKPRWVIPMHYGTFPVLTGTAEELMERLKGEPEITVIPLKPGETVE